MGKMVGFPHRERISIDRNVRRDWMEENVELLMYKLYEENSIHTGKHRNIITDTKL